MLNSGQWKKGESGNPKGRPRKGRALTELLMEVGDQELEFEGQQLSGKKVLAILLWRLLTGGTAVLPNGVEIKVSTDSWINLVRFLYKHVDGPPPQDVNLDGQLNIPVTIVVGGIDPNKDI